VTICPQCGYERTNNDDSFVSSEECPKCGIIYKKWTPSFVLEKNKEHIITSNETSDGNKKRITPLKTEISNFNNTKSKTRKLAIIIGLGVLFYISSFFPLVFNKYTFGRLSSLTSLISVMIGGTFRLLGEGLILVGIVFGLRAIVFKTRKPSADLKSNESMNSKVSSSYNPKEEGKKSAKLIGFGLLCLFFGIAIFILYIFVMPKDTHGKLDPFFIVIIMICGLCQLLAFILIVAGTILGFRSIFRRRELKESLQVKDDQNIDQQRRTEENWGAEWVSVITLPLTILLAFIFLMAILWGNKP